MTNDKLVLWIIFNLVNLQYVFIIYLARIKHDLENNTQLTFKYEMAIINPIAIAKFFHIIWNAIFYLLHATY